MIRLLAPPLSPEQVVVFSQSLQSSLLTLERGGWAKNQIIRPWDRLVLYKSFNPLWIIRWILPKVSSTLFHICNLQTTLTFNETRIMAMKSDQSRFIHLTTGLVLAKNDIEMWYLIQSYHFTLMFISPSHCTRFELPVARRTTRRQLASKYVNGFVKKKSTKDTILRLWWRFIAVS
jgi:hypothetical protein